MEYVSFSDESYITAARFRSICCVSLPEDRLAVVNDQIRAILRESDVAEFKWLKTRNAKYRLCADKLFRFAIQHISESGIRIDILIWDTQDSRHSVSRRDDDANYERMFFHLLKTAMKRRERNSIWSLFPDEKLGVDWETIRECLQHVGQQQQITAHPLLSELYSDTYYNIRSFQQINSSAPCVQLADFFAGIAVFTREKHQRYVQWSENESGTLSLFQQENVSHSGADRERFPLIRDLNQTCKQYRLGVSLKERQAFWTPDPRNPLNFWHYVPQHENDRAPTSR